MSKYGNRIIKTKWNDKETIGFLTGIKISGIDNGDLSMKLLKSLLKT